MTQVQTAARPGSGAPDQGTACLPVGAILAAQFGFMLVGARIGPNTGAGNGVALAGTAAVVALALLFQRKLGLPVGEFGLERPSSWGSSFIAMYLGRV